MAAANSPHRRATTTSACQLFCGCDQSAPLLAPGLLVTSLKADCLLLCALLAITMLRPVYLRLRAAALSFFSRRWWLKRTPAPTGRRDAAAGEPGLFRPRDKPWYQTDYSMVRKQPETKQKAKLQRLRSQRRFRRMIQELQKDGPDHLARWTPEKAEKMPRLPPAIWRADRASRVSARQQS